MRQPRTVCAQVRSMMAPANPVPGGGSGSGWHETPGQEIYQQIIAQPRDQSAVMAEPAPTGQRGRYPWPVASPRQRTGPRRSLTAAAAVLAVLAVLAGLTLAVGARAGRTAPPQAASSDRPPFYVTINGYDPYAVAQVHDSGTGRVLSSVRLPRGVYQPSQVTGSADGRVFLIDQGTQLPHSETGNRVYRLRVSADGRSAGLTALSIALLPRDSSDWVTGLALSPDGTRLAATIIQPGGGYGGRGEIEIVSLRGGATRTWTAQRLGQPSDPSWSGDGSRLTFLWWDHITGSDGVYTSWRSQVRMLDATAPGGDLLASRVIAGDERLGLIQSAIAAPDGKVIIAAAARNAPGPGGSGVARLQLVALAPGTGRVITVYASRSIRYRGPLKQFYADGSCQVYGVNAAGSQSLVGCTRVGLLDNGVITALPGPSSYGTAAW